MKPRIQYRPGQGYFPLLRWIEGGVVMNWRTGERVWPTEPNIVEAYVGPLDTIDEAFKLMTEGTMEFDRLWKSRGRTVLAAPLGDRHIAATRRDFPMDRRPEKLEAGHW